MKQQTTSSFHQNTNNNNTNQAAANRLKRQNSMIANNNNNTNNNKHQQKENNKNTTSNGLQLPSSPSKNNNYNLMNNYSNDYGSSNSNNLSNSELREMKETFEAFDQDHSGTIDVEELQQIMKHLGHNISERDSAVLLQQVSNDPNRDGLLFDELVNLPFIGPTLAKRIMEYRRKRGKFDSVEELKNIPGIKQSGYEKISKYLRI